MTDRSLICEQCGDEFQGRRGQRFCNPQCWNLIRRRDAVERFWEKVDIQLEGGCWVWMAAVHPGTGYGIFGAGQGRPTKTVRADKYAYQLLVGPIPDEQMPLHLCGLRHCVNPGHMELGPIPAPHSPIAVRRKALDCCNRGHRFTLSNTIIRANGNRTCRTCRNVSSRKYAARKRSDRARGEFYCDACGRSFPTDERHRRHFQRTKEGSLCRAS
jgi:hypothetical protein